MNALSDLDLTLPVGSIVPADVDGAAMAVLHTQAGWVMTPDRCPHGDCPFTQDGELADDGVLICNCHGSEFDPVTGALLQGPAIRGLSITRLPPDPTGSIVAPDVPDLGG